MKFDLTNASARVLRRAAHLTLPLPLMAALPGAGVSASKLLLSLFDEEECRAAGWLLEADLSPERFQNEIVANLLPREVDPEKISDENPRPATKKSSNDYGEKKIRGRLQFFLDDTPISFGKIAPELELALETLTHRFGRPKPERRRISGSSGSVTSVAVVAASSGESAFLPAFALATEHLLLAALLAEGPVGNWLRDKGFDEAALCERIENLGTNSVTADETPAWPMEEDVLETENTEPLLASSRPPSPQESMIAAESPAEIDARIYRLIDAALNRAREAVRVVEDYVRFVLDDEALTRRLKDFRHRFHEVSQVFCNASRLAARNTDGDVGTEIEGANEYKRFSAQDVLAANFARLQESLRSLEEFSKLLAPQTSKCYENLRYQCYSLHKTVGLAVRQIAPETAIFRNNKQDESVDDTIDAKTLLAQARLYALVDCRSDADSFAALIHALIEGGVEVLQLRDKKADDRTLLDRSKILKQIIASSSRPTLFVMNDRPDLAKLAGADGVHVGQEELSVAEVRQIVGTKMLVGVSTHDIQQARNAIADGADYIGAGPVFPSSTKDFETTVGLEYLKQIADEPVAADTPAFAIGGITLNHCDSVLATGIRQVAVSAALTGADDPKAAAEAFCSVLRREKSAVKLPSL